MQKKSSFIGIIHGLENAGLKLYELVVVKYVKRTHKENNIKRNRWLRTQ